MNQSLPLQPGPLVAERDAPTMPSPAVAATAMVLALLWLGAAIAWASWHRGPWYDEFFSWHVTRPGRGFAQSLGESWLADNHPPLFYALVWLGRFLAGTIESARLINLAALIAAMLAGWALLRRVPQLWWTAAAFVLVLAAAQAALLSGAELRSYFLSFLASAVVVLALTVGWLQGQLARREQHLALGAALLIGFNLHILTSVIIGALLVPFVAAAWLRGQHALARAILVPACLAGTILVATLVIQVPLWLSNTADFWIPAGFDAARWSIQYAVQRTFEGNPVILLGAVLGGVALLTAAWRNRKPSPELEATLLLGLGVGLACALVVALHLWRPVVMERYLTPLIPPIAMGMALGFAKASRMVPYGIAAGLLGVALAFTGWAAADNARAVAAARSWNGSAALAGRVQRACGDSPVHIDPPYWNAYTISLPPADNRAVFAAAHAQLARRGSFTVEPAGSRRLSERCPNLFWAEHDTSRLWDETRILAHLRASGFEVNRVWQYRLDDGWIASDRPLSAADPASWQPAAAPFGALSSR